MKKTLLALIILLAPAASGWTALIPEVPVPLAKPLANDPLGVTIHRLENGLTIYLSPNHEEPRITTWIAVRAGGAHDPGDSTGMAHYQEHMLFKGSRSLGTSDYTEEKRSLDRIFQLYERLFTTKDPAQRKSIYKEIDEENVKAGKIAIPNEIDKAYKSLGFDGLNAFTSNEQTVYISNMPSNRKEVWARLEADRFANPVFRLFQSEIETVYEEKNRAMDNAGRVIRQAVLDRLYPGHPYGRPILGSIEHLKNPSLKKMYAFYERHYVPGNMALILSGDFEREPMLAVIEKHFGSWKAKEIPAQEIPPVKELTTPERVEVAYEAEEQVIIAWQTVPKGHPDYEAAVIMDMLMDNSQAGIINLRLNQAQKVKQAGSYPSFHNQAGAWYLYAIPKQGQTLEQAEGLLMETVAALKNGEFADEDIKSIITDFEIEKKRSLESNDNRVAMMAGSFTEFESWDRTVSALDRMRQVTKEDVLRVANKYLGEGRVVAFRRNAKPELPSMDKPGFTQIPIDPSRQSDFFKEIIAMKAEPIEPKWLEEGRDYTISTLAEGKLYAAENPFNDLFSLSFVFDRGNRRDRELCAAIDLLRLSGAGALSADALKKKLYSLGITLGYSCGRDQMSVSLSGLDKNLWRGLELLHERMNSPNIAPGTLEKMVEVELGAHQDNKKNPQYILLALAEFAARGKESSVLAELNDAELKKLKVEPLKKKLGKVFDFKHRITYIGNRSAGELAKLIATGRKKFADTPKRPPLRYLKPQKDGVVFTHRDMVQSQVGLSAADEILNPEHSEDYRFYSSYMGGGMSSVIFQEIRESRALAYSAWGGYKNAGYAGDENALWGQLGTQADKTIEATRLLSQLLKNLPPSEKRFLETARTIEQMYRTNRIGFREVPGTLIYWENQGLSGGDPRPERYRRSLEYRLSDLERFAGRFKDKPLTIYVLGHKERVDLEALKKIGSLEEKKLEEIFPY